MKGVMALLLVLLVISCLSAVDGYKVVGNKLLLQNGTEVVLRGMCRPSMEWDRNGEQLSLNDYSLMKQWGANLVRVSLNQDFWFEGQTYKDKVAQQVGWIQSLGMGVMFDLHWNGGGQKNMADRNSITFWTQFANVYKSNPNVMFELYNEPHDVSESVWRNGDSNYAGMQEMYDAVRATGANNVVVIGGLDWAFDLQRVYPSYKITGTNITYATHPYNYAGKMQADWPSKFGFVAADYPVIMTEFGQYCATDNYVLDLLNYADQTGHVNPPAKKIHWTGWAWYAKDCWFPSLIADWSGTPTVPVGQVVKNKLGNTTMPTQAPTPAPTVIPATSPYWAYTDSLQNGFADWSWTTDYTIGDTSRAYGGSSKSIRLALQQFEAIYLHKDSNFFTLGSYAAFEFQIYSVVTLNANSDYAVILYSSAAAFPEVSNILGQTTIPANTWTKVSIPISSFTGASTTTFISGFAIQYKKQALAGNAWLDDIAFVPAASSTSTTKAATTSTTKAPTTSTTTTTTAKGTTSTTKAPTTTTSTSTTKAPTTTTTTASATTSTTKTATTTSTSSAATTGSSGCGTGSVTVTQTAGSSWGSPTITQFSVAIKNNCSGKNLVGPLVLAVTNWNPNSYWEATFTASSPGSTSGTLTLPSHINVAPGSSYQGFGYQNIGGQATFTVQTATFQ